MSQTHGLSPQSGASLQVVSSDPRLVHSDPRLVHTGGRAYVGTPSQLSCYDPYGHEHRFAQTHGLSPVGSLVGAVGVGGVVGKQNQVVAGSSSCFQVSSSTSKSNYVSLLPTARVTVQGQGGSVQATLLFDSGSDRSYVTQNLVLKVKAKWVRNTDVSFSTFGGRSHGTRSKVFEMDLADLSVDSQVSVELTEVPIICLPLSKPEIDSSILSRFGHLELAYDHAKSSDLNIDILIGQDLFWSLMHGRVFRDDASDASLCSDGYYLAD